MSSEHHASELSDELLAAAVHDMPNAFAVLYARHVRRVYRYAVVKLQSVYDAEDVCAQTFTIAFQSIERYRGKGPFVAWLIGIARNLIADHYRSHRPVLSLESIDNLPDGARSLDLLIDQKLQLARLLTALDALPPDQAEVIRLRIFAELSTADTARIMSRSEAAIKMLLHRAVQALRARSGIAERDELNFEGQ